MSRTELPYRMVPRSGERGSAKLGTAQAVARDTRLRGTTTQHDPPRASGRPAGEHSHLIAVVAYSLLWGQL